jgi:alpha-glucosidase (family GH31 glycosyl hydrolase)
MLKSLYVKKFITGISAIFPILILSFLMFIYLLGIQSSSQKAIIIDLKPKQVPDTDYPVYRASTPAYSSEKPSGFLQLESEGKQPYGKNIRTLEFETIYIDKDILRIIIRDVSKKNWFVNDFNHTSKYIINNYEFKLVQYPFSFEVIRKSDGLSLFNTANMGFYFSTRYIELETYASENRIAFGIGQRNGNFRLDVGSYDIWPRSENPGHHPFYIEINQKKAHGVFMHNFNAMEIQYNKKSMKFRMTGGVVDLFVILGDSPEQVVRNYHKVIGLPSLPPFWALGYNYGKEGWDSVDEIRETMNLLNASLIPYDSLFLSANYLDTKTSFTVSAQYSNISQIKDKLESEGKHLIIEIPSSITINSNAYKKLKNVLIPVTSLSSYGLCSYIDWYNPSSKALWSDLLQSFESLIDFDGVFLTDNEISSLNYTSLNSVYLIFKPGNLCLDNGTIPMSTVHYNNAQEIDVHSLWGDYQVNATKQYLDQYGRSMIVSSNSRAGIKSFHIFSDNDSTWKSFRESIASVLAFEVFGVRSGADICGHKGDDSELCKRWHELGVFYPLMRYYKSKDSGDLSTLDSETLSSIKSSIQLRYSMSLYIYSLYFEASLHGGTILRPMFFEFDDISLLNFPDQIMLGPALFGVFPLYSRNQGMNVYFPSVYWYNLITGYREIGNGIKVFNDYSDTVFYIKGGSAIPWANSVDANSLMSVRTKDIELIIALDETYSAYGSFYTDDGASLNTIQNKKFTKVNCQAQFREKLTIKVWSVVNGYTEQFRRISAFKVFGCNEPYSVKIDTEDQVFTYKDNILTITTNISTYSFSEISIYLI